MSLAGSILKSAFLWSASGSWSCE